MNRDHAVNCPRWSSAQRWPVEPDQRAELLLDPAALRLAEMASTSPVQPGADHLGVVRSLDAGVRPRTSAKAQNAVRSPSRRRGPSGPAAR